MQVEKLSVCADSLVNSYVRILEQGCRGVVCSSLRGDTSLGSPPLLWSSLSWSLPHIGLSAKTPVVGVRSSSEDERAKTNDTHAYNR